MIVKADGQKAVVRIARQDSTATGTVYYKWDTAAEWTEVNQTASVLYISLMRHIF